MCAQPLLQFYSDLFEISHGLKMFMWLGHYQQIIFLHFFQLVNLVIFLHLSGYIVSATPTYLFPPPPPSRGHMFSKHISILD